MPLGYLHLVAHHGIPLTLVSCSEGSIKNCFVSVSRVRWSAKFGNAIVCVLVHFMSVCMCIQVCACALFCAISVIMRGVPERSNWHVFLNEPADEVFVCVVTKMPTIFDFITIDALRGPTLRSYVA